MVDGLKPGQRKILYGCFKRNLVKEIKARGCCCRDAFSCVLSLDLHLYLVVRCLLWVWPSLHL